MTEPALFCQLRNVVMTSKMKTNELNLMKKLVWNHIIRVSKYLSNNIIEINTISVNKDEVKDNDSYLEIY